MDDTKIEPQEPKPIEPIPVAIQRLLDEVRCDAGVIAIANYNRRHNRHNRS